MKDDMRVAVYGRYFIREERNGITVYNKLTHIYWFYEGLSIHDLEKNHADEGAGKLEDYLESQSDRRTKHIESDYPFYIGWQLSGTCNLDCIYCFAENKIHNRDTDDIMDVANTILGFRPISVGLSGGEPTLNPRLGDIMRLFHGKTNCVLNTNGTTAQLEKLLPIMKETNCFVRMTIDTFDNDLLNTLRPPVRMPEGGFDQISKFKHNIRLMQEAGINFMIHTVITSKNLPMTEQTAEELIKLGVKRWHMYSVDYSEKCKDIYDSIKVTHEQMRENHANLTRKYGDKLEITSTLDDLDFRERAVLLVDSTGRFLVDTIKHGNVYIGRDPKHPTYEELMQEMNYELHKSCYLRNLWS
ncbi:MAG: radical SAM protein [Lachnospiraceae bacterium]|nr:radical SAM protein [Lachnospiraceae bacterium]